MPMFTYTTNIPATNNNPSADQPNMLTNTNSTNSILAVDHNSFNVNNGGFHTVIHQVTQVSDPAAIPSTDQIYAKNYTPNSTVTSTDTQLFSITGAGSISQITGYNTSDPNFDNGYQWLGGVLLQWGRVTNSFASTTTVGTVTFKDRSPGMIPFPNTCFTVMTTPVSSSSSNPNSALSIALKQATLNNLGFTWVGVTGSHDYTGFRWIAIGN